MYRVVPLCCKTGTLMSEFDQPLDVVAPRRRSFFDQARDALQARRDTIVPPPRLQDAPPEPNSYLDRIPDSVRNVSRGQAQPDQVEQGAGAGLCPPESVHQRSAPGPSAHLFAGLGQQFQLPQVQPAASPLEASPTLPRSMGVAPQPSGISGQLAEALIRITPEEVQPHPQAAPAVRPLLPAPIPSPALDTTTRSNFTQPPTARVVLSFNILETLTACLDSAECPQTARIIFQTLFELGLETVRARNLPTRPDVAVFHLPVELLASHLEVSRITVWRNLKPLIEAGIVANRDHYDTLRGASAISGKIWAVSLAPARVMAGKAPHVRVTKDDLAFHWRDLDADARKGRTAYSATRTEAQQALEKAQREAAAEKKAAARARAEARAKDREAACKRGEKPLRGRAAATANAAKTRAENPPPMRGKGTVQQSINGLKAVSKEELKRWALAPFFENFDVTLTVSRGLGSARDAIYTLPLLTGLSRRERGAAVEGLAQQLAVAFEDHQNVRFWLWLTWQVLRGFDQGQDYSDDIALILSRVLHDIKHDESMRNRSVLRPGALVVNELRNGGLLDALRQIAPTRVGVRPKAAAQDQQAAI